MVCADLILAMVLAGSVVALINRDVHNARSSESRRSGVCPPSSSPFVNVAVSFSCMNRCSSVNPWQTEWFAPQGWVLVAVGRTPLLLVR